MSERCGFQSEDLSAYLDGELSAAEVQVVEAHLADCERCRRSLEALRRTRALVLGLPSTSPPPEFREGLREALRAAGAPKHSRGVRSRGGGWHRGLALVAASILVVLLPMAALVSTMMVPTEDQFPLLAADPPPGEMGIMETAPEISTEEAADPPRDVEEIVASETYIIRVDDVEIATPQARSALLDGGGEVLGLTRTYDAAGYLNKAVLVGDLPRDAILEMGERAQQIGILVERRREETSYGDPGTRTEVILSLEKMEHVVPPADGDELVRAEALRRPGALGERIRRSFSGSWTRFGAGVATALVWIAGHLPHLAFAVGAIILVFAVSRRGTRSAPPKK